MTRLLEISGLDLSLDGHPILAGIQLSVAEGELHALLGANGAGKSSLAHCLMGCTGYRPSAGEIRFADQDIVELPLHERARLGLALAWQEPARFEGLRVADYLGIGAKADLGDCLGEVGLTPKDYLERPLDKTLSGGERKRIELAGVLALRPRLAILDEPTAGIDFLSQGAMVRVIQALRRQGAVLLITHQESLAAGADRATQLCGGRIVCRGDAAQVIASFKSRRCRRCDGETCGYD
jgi:Fe-S cluster assembly ATP-binding protein